MVVISAEKLGFDPDRLNRITDWMQRYVDEKKFPGSSLLIKRNGSEVFYSNVGIEIFQMVCHLNETLLSEFIP